MDNSAEQKKPGWMLAVMVCWYALCLLGTGFIALIGMAFGSEVHRGDPIPLLDTLMVIGPFLINIALLVATVVLWNKDKVREATLLWGASFLLALGAMGFFSGVAI